MDINLPPIVKVAIKNITPNPWNPNRQTQAQLKATIESIRDNGFVAPIQLRQMEDGTYQILGGYHRYQALQALKMAEIWAFDRGMMSDAEAKIKSLQDNLHGTDLPLEWAKVIYDLTQAGMSLDTIARKVGKPRIELTDALRVLDIPTELKNLTEDLNRPHMVEMTFTLDEEPAELLETIATALDDMLAMHGAKVVDIKQKVNRLRESVNVLTVSVLQPQRDVVELAIETVQGAEGEKVKRGRALELIAADYLAGHRLEAKPDLSLKTKNPNANKSKGRKSARREKGSD